MHCYYVHTWCKLLPRPPYAGVLGLGLVSIYCLIIPLFIHNFVAEISVGFDWLQNTVSAFANCCRNSTIWVSTFLVTCKWRFKMAAQSRSEIFRNCAVCQEMTRLLKSQLISTCVRLWLPIGHLTLCLTFDLVSQEVGGHFQNFCLLHLFVFDWLEDESRSCLKE